MSLRAVSLKAVMPIKPLRSDADYDAALEEIERLFASEPGSEDADCLEVLVVLAQDYQRLHSPVGPPDVSSAIEFELDRRGLTRPETRPETRSDRATQEGRTTENAIGNPPPPRIGRVRHL
jgi:antitoxin component HigA of HigAB toxin-antitoxin module